MFIKGISKGEFGNLGPYFSLLTIIMSLGNKVFFIEELGILNTPKTKILKINKSDNNKNSLKTISKPLFK